MKHILTLSALAVAALAGGCAETLDTHGQVVLPSQLAKIKPGETTQAQVRQLLGTPSATGTLNDQRWYYITSVVGQKAFNPYDLKSRRTLVLDFDPSSTVVTSMVQRTEADGKALDPDRAMTETQGQTMGFFDQMFGNMGLGNK
jgi:outer membrane protein assembly factor BamE (lipoprotein component of BamABCDE complex)